MHLAATPRDLLRARYVAYGVGAVDYLIATTDPRGSQWHPDRAAWTADLRAYCKTLRLAGLDIRTEAITGDRGAVRYVAQLRLDGRPATLAEDARYRKDGDRWLYVDGDAWDPFAQ